MDNGETVLDLAQVLAGACLFGAETSRSSGAKTGLKIAIKLVRHWIIPRAHLYKELPAAARFTRKVLYQLKKAQPNPQFARITELRSQLPFMLAFLKIAEHDPHRVIGPYYELQEFLHTEPIDLAPYLRVAVSGRSYWWVGATTPEQLEPLRRLLRLERLSQVVQECCADLAENNPTKALDDHVIIQAGSTTEACPILIVMRTTVSNLLKEVQGKICVLDNPDAIKELSEDMMTESKAREREELNFQAGLRREN
jgi:hypothetical protein